MREAFVPLAHPAGHAQADFGDGTRKRNTLFGALQSHYVFEDSEGCPGKGSDKRKSRGWLAKPAEPS